MELLNQEQLPMGANNYMDKDATASPTTLIELILITSVIDAKEERNVATVDIPNAFI